MLLHHSVKLNNKGMSLIEVMAAMLILLIVAMALLQTSLLGYQENVRNSLREEAIRIADQQIGDYRAWAYTQTLIDNRLNSGVTTTTVTRYIRSFKMVSNVTTTISDISANNKQVSVGVTWTFKGKTYGHNTAVILGRK